MRTALALALLLSSAAAHAQAPAPKDKAKVSAHAPPAPSHKEAVMAALQGSTPLTPARMAELGPDADLALIDVLRDGKLSATVHGRAVDGLAASGSKVARDHLVRVAMATGEVELTVLRRALLGLGWLRDGRAPEIIAPWLDHASAQVRLDAAVALALTKTEAAIDLLTRHNRNEKDTNVRKKIDRLVKRLQEEMAPEPTPRKDQPRVVPPPPMEGRRF